MKDVIAFIINNHQSIVEAAAGLVIAARVIVKLTPTPKDDTALQSVVNFFKHLGLHIGPEKK
jgi:hypothetical protein